MAGRAQIGGALKAPPAAIRAGRSAPLLALLVLTAAAGLGVHMYFRQAASRDLARMGVSELHVVLTQQPGNRAALERLIESYLLDERVEDAVRDARRLAKLAPRSAHAHFLLGKALQKSGNGPAALTALGQAVKLDPRHARAQFLLGHGNYWREQPLIAQRHFDRYVELQPADDIGFRFLGLARLRLGDFAGAEPALRRAVELGPEASGNHQAMGDFYLSRFRDRTDLMNAAASFRKALALQPGSDPIRTQLAQALDRLGLLKDAAAEYELVYSHSPTNERICFALIQIYARMGDRAKRARYQRSFDRITRARRSTAAINEGQPGTPTSPIR